MNEAVVYLILCLIAVIMFRRLIKLVTNEIESEIMTELNENSVERAVRTKEIYEEFKEQVGDNYMSPQALNKLLNRRTIK